MKIKNKKKSCWFFPWAKRPTRFSNKNILHWEKASLVGVAKIAIEKVKFYILATHFSMHTSIDFLFYYLFSLNIILCERKRKRDKIIKQLFLMWIMDRQKGYLLFTL
jgi:hypothetical protein